MTKIEFSSPNTTNIPDPTDIVFTYDAAGNRTYMSDGTGNLTYSYDELSRLKEETKDFADTLSNEISGGYKLKYNYFLTDGLKSIEDPFGAKATYESDKLGRTTAIGGDEFYNGTTEITSFASSINYRAFGAIKSMSYNTTLTTNVTLSYDTRLRLDDLFGAIFG